MTEYVMIKDGVNKRTYSYKTAWGSGQTTSKRFTCIGGDFNGQRLSRIDLIIAGQYDDYYGFNRAGGTKDARDTMIFIHRSFIDNN